MAGSGNVPIPVERVVRADQALAHHEVEIEPAAFKISLDARPETARNEGPQPPPSGDGLIEGIDDVSVDMVM